jgi:hypothetical protein
MTTHGLQRYVDDLLRGRRPTRFARTILSHSTILTDRTGPDRLVPRQQRFSQYTRSLIRALDVPVQNIWALRPAVVEGTREIAPLTAIRDLDSPRLLDNVTYSPPVRSPTRKVPG